MGEWINKCVKSAKSLKSLFSSLPSSLKEDSVYALVGHSGTGKSYNAKIVAARFNLQAIIDDGLLIAGDQILAGHTAKGDKSFLTAVRTAVFDDDIHRTCVVRAIKRNHIHRILIIGTSEKMVKKIANRLEIQPPTKIIHIEDITTAEQIEAARKSRQIEGKHVIPVASLEVKTKYPKIYTRSIRFKFHRPGLPQALAGRDTGVVEKSIVQPVFSRPVRTEVSQAALARMAGEAAAEGGAVVKLLVIKAVEGGYKIFMTIDITADGTSPLTRVTESLKRSVVDTIEREAEAFVEDVAITIDRAIVLTPMQWRPAAAPHSALTPMP